MGSSKKKKSSSIYGEFIRTFVFSGLPQLPIVQPGGRLVFPIATVTPNGVQYVDEDNRVGLLVPRGTYLVTWSLNPSEGAVIDLLVNNQKPGTVSPPNFSYGRTIATEEINKSYVVEAPLKKDNLISFVNSGQSLMTLNDISNTRIGAGSILTQVRVVRL